MPLLLLLLPACISVPSPAHSSCLLSGSLPVSSWREILFSISCAHSLLWEGRGGRFLPCQHSHMPNLLPVFSCLWGEEEEEEGRRREGEEGKKKKRHLWRHALLCFLLEGEEEERRCLLLTFCLLSHSYLYLLHVSLYLLYLLSLFCPLLALASLFYSSLEEREREEGRRHLCLSSTSLPIISHASLTSSSVPPLSLPSCLSLGGREGLTTITLSTQPPSFNPIIYIYIHPLLLISHISRINIYRTYIYAFSIWYVTIDFWRHAISGNSKTACHEGTMPALFCGKTHFL